MRMAVALTSRQNRNASPDDMSSPSSTPSEKSQQTIAAVIPAYNEAGRIGPVLDILIQVGELTEIIVVDDGSHDATLKEAVRRAGQDSRVRIIQHEHNRGKGQALFTGWQSTQAEMLLFLDADLIGLTPQHVRDLICPVTSGQADASIGLFRGGHMDTTLSHILTPWLTGQRCLRSSLMEYISPEAALGYGFETAMAVAARQQNWRVRKVILQDVWHPPSETHRGFEAGVKNRISMYAQIVRAWWLASRRKGFFPRINGRARVFIIIFLLAVFSIAYNSSMAFSEIHLSDMAPFPLEGARRLLIVAPHPDDETIGSGGLVQAALARGLQVRVVILTNGDGQALAPLALEGHLMTRPRDYISDGIRRQSESLSALSRLGLPAGDVYFLGYPDSQLSALWLNDWDKNCPLLGKRTHATSSPYPITFDPASLYCGSSLLNDLHDILNEYRPDLVIIPHPNDEHPDHRAASEFTMMAIALDESQNPGERLAVYGYLVHYGFYPRPRGWHRDRYLLPPTPLSGPGNSWYNLELSPEQIQTKEAAIRDYATQMRLLMTFLPSFVRRNEIYEQIHLFDSSVVAVNSSPLLEQGILQSPAMTEPSGESARRLFVSGSDLVGYRVVRLGDTLWLTMMTRGRLLPGLNYVISLKTTDGKTHKVTIAPTPKFLLDHSFTYQVNLADLGNPDVLGFEAEVQQGVVLDRSAWHFIILRDQ